MLVFPAWSTNTLSGMVTDTGTLLGIPAIRVCFGLLWRKFLGRGSGTVKMNVYGSAVLCTETKHGTALLETLIAAVQSMKFVQRCCRERTKNGIYVCKRRSAV